MKRNRKITTIIILIIGLIGILAFTQIINDNDNNILSYEVDLNKQDLKLYWKNEKGEIFKKSPLVR